MRKKDSVQVLTLKRLLSLCNEHTTARGFTEDEIARWPPIRDRKPKRNSVNKALHRFISIGIVFSPRAI